MPHHGYHRLPPATPRSPSFRRLLTARTRTAVAALAACLALYLLLAATLPHTSQSVSSLLGGAGTCATLAALADRPPDADALLHLISTECGKRQPTYISLTPNRTLHCAPADAQPLPSACHRLEIMLGPPERTFGMCADAAFYVLHLGARIVPYSSSMFPRYHEACSPPHTRTRLHFETLYGEAVHGTARGLRHAMLVNSDHMYSRDILNHRRMHLFLCKTHFCTALVQAYTKERLMRGQVLYVGHSSLDPVADAAPAAASASSVEISGAITSNGQHNMLAAGSSSSGPSTAGRDVASTAGGSSSSSSSAIKSGTAEDRARFQQVLHVRGKSGLKHTRQLLECWATRPDFPTLTVVAYDYQVDHMLPFVQLPNVRFVPAVPGATLAAQAASPDAGDAAAPGAARAAPGVASAAPGAARAAPGAARAGNATGTAEAVAGKHLLGASGIFHRMASSKSDKAAAQLQAKLWAHRMHVQPAEQGGAAGTQRPGKVQLPAEATQPRRQGHQGGVTEGATAPAPLNSDSAASRMVHDRPAATPASRVHSQPEAGQQPDLDVGEGPGLRGKVAGGSLPAVQQQELLPGQAQTEASKQRGKRGKRGKHRTNAEHEKGNGGLWFTGNISTAEVHRLQLGAGIHVCVSEREGFGHYLNEAYAAGALVVTTDHPPMNELIRPGMGVVVAPQSTSSYPSQALGRYADLNAFVEPSAICAAMDRVLQLPLEVRVRIGRQARMAFLQDRCLFEQRLRQLKRLLVGPRRMGRWRLWHDMLTGIARE